MRRTPSYPPNRRLRARWLLRAWVAAVAMALMPCATSAEAVRLKLSYFGSEQALVYRAGIKPFVDAINAEGQGLVSIDVYAEGTLGRTVAEQPALVQKGTADIAWVAPGQTPYRFPDNRLFELPGLARDAREGTLIATRLTAAGLLRGYEDFVVIGAYATGLNVIHSRKPIGSLAALRGMRIRVNNEADAEVLSRLNAIPTILPVPQVAAALDRGTIDGAVVSLTGYFDYGVAAVGTHHFLLHNGTAPLALLMSRSKFDSLPDAAKGLIRKYSGEWAAKIWIEAISSADETGLARLRADRAHTVVDMSAADRLTAEGVYRALIENWAAGGERNRTLLTRLEAELAAIRAAARQ
jgi:TRAP-type C4-dicarboxylate transport system substrate-binding protein